MDILDKDFSRVWPLSQGAVAAAREYVALIEDQLDRAHSVMRASALAEYKASPGTDDADYQGYVSVVDRAFEHDYRPIMRFTETVYLYMIFEVYVRQHVAEILALSHDRRGTLQVLQRGAKHGFLRSAQKYIRDDAGLRFFTEKEWDTLYSLACLRNCIIHNGGVTRGYRQSAAIYGLENQTWQRRRIGIRIGRYQGHDLGEAIIIERRFIEYFLDLLERFFVSLAQAVDIRFRNEKKS